MALRLCTSRCKKCKYKMPTIEALKQPGYEYTQSKTWIMPRLPVRGLVLAPGSGGKTTMLVRLLVDKEFWGGKFARIYWFSPSATVDDSLDPLRDYVKKYKIKRKTQHSMTNLTQFLLESCWTDKKNHRVTKAKRIKKEI